MTKQMIESEIQWIGEIPSTWGITKVKNFVKIRNGKDNTAKEGSVPVFGSGGKFGYTDQVMFDKESVLLGRKGTIDKPKFVTEPFWAVDTTFYTEIKKGMNLKFFYYCMLSIDYKEYIYGSAIPSMSQSILNEIYLPNPKLDIQQKVTDFLDKKVLQIDSILEDTKVSLTEFQNYKRALITETVTKGLNTDTPMKDSHNEWIGRVPQHWEVKKIKTLFSEINVRNTEDENARLLSLFTAIGVKPRSEMEDKGNKNSTVINYKIVKKGDLVVNKLLAWMGSIGFSEYEGVTSPDYDVYRALPHSNVVQGYYNYYFRHTNFKDDCYKFGRGIMMMRWRTYPEQFKQIPVVNPPYKEQQQIVEFLDEKCAHIDSLIEQKQQLLIELETYKKSFIYEYVTGKKEVL